MLCCMYGEANASPFFCALEVFVFRVIEMVSPFQSIRILPSLFNWKKEFKMLTAYVFV